MPTSAESRRTGLIPPQCLVRHIRQQAGLRMQVTRGLLQHFSNIESRSSLRGKLITRRHVPYRRTRLGLRHRLSQSRAEDKDFPWRKTCFVTFCTERVCVCERNDKCYGAETRPKFFSRTKSVTATMTPTAIELQIVHDPDYVSRASLATASGLPSNAAQVTRSDATATPRLEVISPNGSLLVDGQDPSRFTTTIVIVLVTLVTALSSLLAGVITVAIPSVAVDIGLSPDLILWCVK